MSDLSSCEEQELNILSLKELTALTEEHIEVLQNYIMIHIIILSLQLS